MPVATTEQTLIALLVVAAIVAIAVSFFRLPYTIALVGVGLFLSFGDVLEFNLTRDLILLVFLPPLLFEGALNMDLDDLRRRAPQVGVLAILGTVVSVAVLAGGFLLLGFGIAEAVLLGVMIAPTDPVSVLAIFKEHGVGAGLRTIMEGESIFNDAIAIVLYLITVEVVEGNTITWQSGVFEFGIEVGIGIAAGAIVGVLAHRLMSTVDNHLIELTLSLTTAYGAYLVADQVHGSGVIATTVAGLLIGNYGTRMAMSASSRLVLYDFWETVSFMFNSLLFLLIGLSFDVASLIEGPVLLAIAVGFGAMLAGRALISYGMLRPFTGSDRPNEIPPSWLHAIFWGGLRGAIPIALVLGLTDREIGGVDAVAVVFGVVLLSLLGQGLTYRPLLARLKLIGAGEEIEDFEEAYARSLALRSSLRELEAMQARGEVVPAIYERLRDDFGENLAQIDRELRRMALDDEATQARQMQTLARRLAAVQRSTLADSARRGIISTEVSERMQANLEEALEVGATDPGEGAKLAYGLFADREESPEPDQPHDDQRSE